MSTTPNQAEQKLQTQADEYAFPYHYIPQPFGQVWLARHWGFAPSYVAALELVLGRLAELYETEGNAFRHIDIGCGDGALLHYLLQSNPELEHTLTGIDTDARSIEWAKMFSPSIDFQSVDIAQVEQKYSSVSLIEVAEHIPTEDLSDFLGLTAKILEPEGNLILTVPSVEKRIYEKHFQHFSMDSLKTLLEPNFKDIRIKGFERKDKVTNFLQRLSTNSHLKIDAPSLNRKLVDRLATLHDRQIRCGRLFATAKKR